MKIGFLGALGLLFIGLKLAGFITWSWLWVLAPLWIVPAVILIVVLVGAIAGVLEVLMDRRNRRKKQDANRKI
jgi:Flp pilus assembly protein TadB